LTVDQEWRSGMSIPKRLPSNWLWLSVNLGALLPLIRLVWMVTQAPTSQGPVIFEPGIGQNIVLFSGQSALVLLVLSLACTPAARIFGWTQAIQVRKALGLWGFGYACFHALFFLGGKELFLLEPTAWSNAWQMLPPILTGLTKTPYAREGAYALAMLAVLALTSNHRSMRLLRHHWKRLHRLVYVAVPLAIYHYWQREIWTVAIGEAPAYWRPATFALMVAILLIVRIPPVRRRVAALVGGRRQRKSQTTPAPARMVVVPNAPHHPEANGAVSHDPLPLEAQPVTGPDDGERLVQQPLIEKELS
jgi:sulfoxide reductase heme-binding subunit YedZ